MNRQWLLKFARSQGYKGKAVFSDVLKFLEDSGLLTDDGELKVSVKGGKVELHTPESIWKKSADAATFGDDEADGDDAEDAEPSERRTKDAKERSEKARNARLSESEAGDHELETKSGRAVDAKVWRSMAARKAYDSAASRGNTMFSCHEIAEVCTAHARLKMSGLMNDAHYAQKEADIEICKKAVVEYDNTLGGSLVPEEFSSHVSRVMPRHGVGPNEVRSVSMSRDVQIFNKRTGGSTVYAVGEGVAITQSTPTKTNVTLTTKKLGQLITISSEMMKDAAINVADDLAFEINYGFDSAADAAIFNGDGTSAYWGFTGFRQAFLNLSATRANIAGLVVGAGNTFASLTLANHTETMGRLPDLIQMGTPKWYVHRQYYYSVMVRLAQAVGGVTSTEVENGTRQNIFEGSPVVFCNWMPRVATADTVVALYGDLSLAATLGTNGGVEIVSSDQRYFDQDLTAFRGIRRMAFSVHDIGNASATESLRTPGPVVALALTT